MLSETRDGPLSINAMTQTATLGGQPLNLTAKEFQVLHALANARGRVVSPRELVEEVWGASFSDGAQYLRVFIGRMRAKIEEDPGNPKFLVTERGLGYRLSL
jgi:two-component system, OmpR family, KDP operon response regulator KdpE